ncbi:ImmA/IrrE family metallo-endopeptidase [Thiomicrorhabdus sp. Kp2]|uniref:ImmA/IrrE family metallo-endopeptidase n=1 Tax=Thiomicrorhabdus sp. Kp2 TaxID=1123518 RepID=UPI0004011C42|nr:ImmA/IrrE family metallo-endopeptidase [Thiomicrorhabdus sp. Kp2]
MDNKDIESFAEKVRSALDVSTPVNFIQVIADLYGELHTFSDSECSKEAYIKPLREYNNELENLNANLPLFRIGVHEDYLSANRRRFSIAHELGHLFLHLNFNNPEKWNEKVRTNQPYYRYGSSQQENEAHSFAASFLMPKDEFMSVLNINTDEDENVDIIKVANHFEVSKAAVINRGRWLGVFSWN